MNRGQVADLLAVAQTFDSRTVGQSDVQAWHGALGDLVFDECRDAVVHHYANRTERVMPGHVRARVIAVRQDIAMRALPSGGSDLVQKPDWFESTVAYHKARTREENRLRKERGEPPYYGETVMTSSDGRLR